MANDSRSKLGSVHQKPNGRWVARVSVGYDVDGRRRTKSATFDTRQKAEAWVLSQRVEMGSRPDVGAGITLRRLWPVYQRSKKLTKKTMQTYEWHVEAIWMPALGDVDVSEIAPGMVQGVLDGLTRENAKHAKTALSSVLTFAKQNCWITSNPLHGHKFSYPKREQPDFDDDPFAAIEQTRDVWGVETVLACAEMIRGLPLEPAWLCCVGAGLRVEEALALRRMDVRRVDVGGREITQLAVHAARTPVDGRKATKTAKSARVVGMVEMMGDRLWELVEHMERTESICPVSAANQNKRWRGYFQPLSSSKHVPNDTSWIYRGRLAGLPYLPLSKMRNTHVTLMAEVGVTDAVNALMHGHTQMVERRHYLNPDTTDATLRASDRLRLVG